MNQQQTANALPVHLPQPIPFLPAPARAQQPMLQQMPGVVVTPDGQLYHGYPPIPYPEPAAPDPRPMLLASAGVFGAGVGWGGAQLLGALAGVSTGTLLAATVAVIALKTKLPTPGGTGGGTVYNHTEQHTHHTTATGLFGRANSTINSARTNNFG
ncbi:hypothetical protein OG689_10935 [Kitasatospora sp. NBC_00240]|uniref:hypothetical protein n=1 Tax=Kitasatospora sp. NBC_00240 TaxID=2903567 RepID=UPI0022502B1F|nr:hypothetical protein [Kitasatospora sp. NBC_00240]MCX5209799.1 hypothetical protein [Kitasatospora sp. NBC_00240]